MSNFLYQILHPWHWLTYGQNAAGVAAVAAILGLVGLYFYTRYTRRMMKLGEVTRRATMTPILVSSGLVRFEAADLKHSTGSEIGLTEPEITAFRAILTIRNVGEGAAIYLRAWAQTVSKEFRIGGSIILIRTNHSVVGEPGLSELLKGESTEARFERFKPSELSGRLLFVVESSDAANIDHQLQMLYSGWPNGEVQMTTVHGLENSPKQKMPS